MTNAALSYFDLLRALCIYVRAVVSESAGPFLERPFLACIHAHFHPRRH